MQIGPKTRHFLLFSPVGLAGLATLLGSACARGVESLDDFGPEGGAAGVGVGEAGTGVAGSRAGAPAEGGGSNAPDASTQSGGAAGGSTSDALGGSAGLSPVDGAGGGSGSGLRDGPLADRPDASNLDAFEGAPPPKDASPDVACVGAGTALSFDGAKSSTVVIPGASLPLGSSQRTVEMWVLSKSPMSNWASDHTLFEYGGRNDLQAFGVDFDVFPNLELYVIPLNHSLFFNSGAVQDQWFHLAATYDGTTTHAFVNGVEKGSMNVGGIATTASSFYVGSGVARNYVTGSIDEVRLWNVARTQAQIQETMGVRLIGNEPGLIGYWRFDEGLGTTASDATNGKHDGVLTSGPAWIPSPVMLACK